MNDLISVIVPIYNVGPYLEKCINSICKQTYANLEIILVDDGSIDESSEICDRYVNQDERIRVVHKMNGGLTSARKAGIREATGKYTTFVDGDDWIEESMYETLHRDAVFYDVPVVLSGMFRENDSGVYTTLPATKCGTGLFENERYENLRNHLRSFLNWSGCNKLFLSDLVSQELNKIDDDLSGIEDDFFSAGCIARANRVFVEEKVFYHGYDRSESETHRRHPDYYLMLHRALPYYYEMMSYGGKEMEKDLKQSCVSGVLRGIENIFPEMFFPEYYFENQNNLEKNANVVLYGAGNVGECFYQQIINKKMFKIVLWVDKNRNMSSKTQHAVEKPITIEKYEYEYVLIAVLNKDNATSIVEELSEIGISKEKIVWEVPARVTELLGITPV